MNQHTGRGTLPASIAASVASRGDEGYAQEELVAELASAFLCADLSLTPEVREGHAAYIASWLRVLKNDKRAIFSAASHAQKAVDFLHGLNPKGFEGTDGTYPLQFRFIAASELPVCRTFM